MTQPAREDPVGKTVRPFIATHWWPLLLLLLLFGVGSYFIYRTTSSGIGLRDDTFSYFTAAEGLVQGHGYGRIDRAGSFRPLTNFPPGYSALLAATRLLGLDLEAGARLIAGISHGALVFMVGLSILWASESAFFALIGASLILVSPGLLETLSWARSEGPYLSFALASLLILAAAIKKRARWLHSTSALLTALAFLTRYVGLSLVATGAVALLISPAGPKRKRFERALLFGGISSAPILAILAANLLISGSATNRPRPFWHPPGQEKLLEGASTILSWIVPASWPSSIPPLPLLLASTALLILLISPVFMGVWGEAEEGRAGPQILAGTHGLHIALYVLALLLSLTLFDRLTPLDGRILSPVHVSLAVILPLILWRMYRGASPAVKGTIIAASLLLVVAKAVPGWEQVDRLSEEGLGFNNDRWRASQTMAYVRNEVPDVPIYTNNVPALYFLADRMASFTPAKLNPASGEPIEEYPHRLHEMRETLKEEDGRLVIVGAGPRGRYPADQFLELTEGLLLLAEFGDGLVYRHDR